MLILQYPVQPGTPQYISSPLHLQVFGAQRDPNPQRDDEKDHDTQPRFTSPTQVIIHCHKSLWYHKICGIVIACFIYQNIVTHALALQ